MRDEFERAILAAPESIEPYAVYADWLIEQGDPRGDLISCQLDLERTDLDRSQRAELKLREAELLHRHSEQWLGELAPHFAPVRPEEVDQWGMNSRPFVTHQWRRGFLDKLTIEALTVRLCHALADSRETRFVRDLHVTSTAYNLGIEDDDEPARRGPRPSPRSYECEWLELLEAPMLGNLRRFQMGDSEGDPPERGWCDNHTRVPDLEKLIGKMGQIEELQLICKGYDAHALFALTNLSKLRVLRMYALGEPNARGDQFEIPLGILAENRSLHELTHLQLHPHYSDDRSFIPLAQVEAVFRSTNLPELTHLQLRMSDMGDAGIEVLIRSGLLERLRSLDLRIGLVTDEGAKMLANHPPTANLEWLDLSRNLVTKQGLEAVRKTGVRAIAEQTLTHSEVDSFQYLHEGDFE
ncbi:MAG: TIGR02996 domain-containing protein [Planctomycetales bacterium]|nr:TIGR02996 domain-containing protein [Planctomycetales bacterium]